MFLDMLLPKVSQAIRSTARPQDLMELPKRFALRIDAVARMGVDMSCIINLLENLASQGEEWEAKKQRATPQMPINQINTLVEKLEKIEAELSTRSKLHDEKKAKLDLHREETASLYAEVEDLLRRRKEAWEHFSRVKNLHIEKEQALKEKEQESVDLSSELYSFVTESSCLEKHRSEVTEQLERLKSERVVNPVAQAEELETKLLGVKKREITCNRGRDENEKRRVLEWGFVIVIENKYAERGRISFIRSS